MKFVTAITVCTTIGSVALLAAVANEPLPTKIVVSDMHCAGCAKKITTKLSKVAGVMEVATDVENKTLTVKPKANAALSPKALWEAVEKAGKTPTRLEGPGGTFTTKPPA